MSGSIIPHFTAFRNKGTSMSSNDTNQQEEITKIQNRFRDEMESFLSGYAENEKPRILLAGATGCGILVGAKIPIAICSRADEPEQAYLSLAACTAMWASGKYFG